MATRSGARISVNSVHEVLVSAREQSTRFMILSEGCVDALIYENGNFMPKFAEYPGFHNVVFCSLRDGRRHETG